MKSTKILVIDDDRDFLEMVGDILEPDYTLVCLPSGEAALQTYEDIHPDIVLVDIGLEGMDGFEVCEGIKEIDKQDYASIVFVSGHESSDECIKAYNVGGDDYISKPFKAAEFKAKVSAIERFHNDKEKLLQSEEMSRKVAFSSMQEASEYGLIIQFLKNSFSCTNKEDLATSLFSILNQLDLKCCVQFRSSFEKVSYRAGIQPCSPIEEKIFETLSESSRIFEFKERTMFNDKHVSLLVKNMPLDDDERYGRLKDILAVIIEGLEARFMDISRQDSFQNIINEVNQTTEKIGRRFSSHEIRVLDIVEGLMDEMTNALNSLALSEEQEDHLIEVVEVCMSKLVSANAESKEIDVYFEELLDHLSYFVTK